MVHMRTLEKSAIATEEWLKAVREQGHFESEQEAYQAFRAVLHALRDRLITEEVADLGAQMPIFIRGVYYDEWVPSQAPSRIRTQQEFIDSVVARLPRGIDPMISIQAVFKVLQDKITNGEIKDVKGNLPEAIRELWPQA